MTTPASKISNVSYISEFESKYQKGMEMSYKVNGNPRTGEFNQKMGSVAILIYERDVNAFLLVRQFRPAVFTSHISRLAENEGKNFDEIAWDTYDPEFGYTLELCAGLMDKEHLTPEQTAAEEIEEECGYKVDPERLLPIATVVVGAHQSGNAQYLYYIEVDQSQKISEGGGNTHEGEVISKVFLSVEEALKLARPAPGENADVKGPPGVLFALQWWFLALNPDKKGLIAKPPTDYIFYPRNIKTITDVTFETDFDKKKYGYNPKRMEFTLNGITRTWDLALCPNTATCILVDMPTRHLILLQTFRPPVFIGRSRTKKRNRGKKLSEINFSKTDPSDAYTLELPVNRVPEGEDPRKFARIAVKQLGYDLKESSLRLLAKCVPGIGQSGDNQFIYLADISQAIQCEKEEDDDVEELRISFNDLFSLLDQELVGPPTVYYAMSYVLDQL